MTRNQIMFVLLTPVLLCGYALTGAGEAVREFVSEWKFVFRGMNR